MIPGVAPAMVVKKPSDGLGIEIKLGYGDFSGGGGIYGVGYDSNASIGSIDNPYIGSLAEDLLSIIVIDYSTIVSPGEKVIYIEISNNVSSRDLHFKITTEDGVVEYDSSDFTIGTTAIPTTTYQAATPISAGMNGIKAISTFPWPPDISMDGKTVYLEITEN